VAVSKDQLKLRDEWYTPDDLFDRLAEKYGPFDLDAAASALNSKCPKFYTVEDDSLSQPWSGRVWCNPPYRNLIDWVTKAYREVTEGEADRVVLLLPGHTATKWFHFALEHGKVEFIEGKVKFGGASGVPFWGSVIVVFDPKGVS